MKRARSPSCAPPRPQARAPTGTHRPGAATQAPGVRRSLGARRRRETSCSASTRIASGARRRFARRAASWRSWSARAPPPDSFVRRSRAKGFRITRDAPAGSPPGVRPHRRRRPARAGRRARAFPPSGGPTSVGALLADGSGESVLPRASGAPTRAPDAPASPRHSVGGRRQRSSGVRARAGAFRARSSSLIAVAPPRRRAEQNGSVPGRRFRFRSQRAPTGDAPRQDAPWTGVPCARLGRRALLRRKQRATTRAKTLKRPAGVQRAAACDSRGDQPRPFQGTSCPPCERGRSHDDRGAHNSADATAPRAQGRSPPGPRRALRAMRRAAPLGVASARCAVVSPCASSRAPQSVRSRRRGRAPAACAAPRVPARAPDARDGMRRATAAERNRRRARRRLRRRAGRRDGRARPRRRRSTSIPAAPHGRWRVPSGADRRATQRQRRRDGRTALPCCSDGAWRRRDK